MQTKPLLRLAAWSAPALIAFSTLSPIGFRPGSGLPPQVERFAAFFIMGAMFGAAYRTRLLRAALLVLGSAAALELLQLLAPGRHAARCRREARRRSVGTVDWPWPGEGDQSVGNARGRIKGPYFGNQSTSHARPDRQEIPTMINHCLSTLDHCQKSPLASRSPFMFRPRLFFRTRSPDRDARTDEVRRKAVEAVIERQCAEIERELDGLEHRMQEAYRQAAFLLDASAEYGERSQREELEIRKSERSADAARKRVAVLRAELELFTAMRAMLSKDI